MLKKLSLLLLVLALFASACGDDEETDTGSADDSADDADDAGGDDMVEDSSDPIIIPIHNWTSQNAGAEIVGQILQMAGANVEYISSDSGAPVYEAMCLGDVSLVHEVWESSFGTHFDAQVEAGCVVEANTHDINALEEWWYPTYLEEVCPGLPDWTALLEADCAAALATPETEPNGRFVSGSVEWVKFYKERIEALGLPFQEVHAGSSDAIWAELDAAYANQEPILNFNWSPNFVDAVYDGKFVEFPAYEPACHDDPSWGINPDLAYDCGAATGAYIKTAAWAGFEEKWPHAYAVLQNIVFTALDVATMAAQGDIDGLSLEDNAAKWLADNDDRVQEWLAVG